MTSSMVAGLASTKIWRGRCGAVSTCSSKGLVDDINMALSVSR